MFKYNMYELETKVLSCDLRDGNYVVTLEDTCFYLESGGQPSDEGTINDIKIRDAYKYDGNVYYVLNEPVEGSVVIKIDQELRMKHMMSHSAQHLVSALFDQIESDTSSLNIIDDSFSIDLSKLHSRKELDLIEMKANEYILRGSKVFEDKHKDSDGEVNGVESDKIRIIEIEGLDRNPCGGTHVDDLRELKQVKIVRSKPSRGGTRIWVYVGDKALKRNQEAYNQYQELLQILGVEEERAAAFLEGRLKDFKRYKKQLKYMKKTTDMDFEL